MGTKQQSFDGFPVEMYAGRFGGTFDLEFSEASSISFDDEVTFVVRGRAAGVDIRETKQGDLKRINVFDVQSVAVLSDTLRNQISKEIDEERGTPQLPLESNLSLGTPIATPGTQVKGLNSIVEDFSSEEVDVLAGPVVKSDSALQNFLDEV
jgi:hypothetical protein